jgi:hypothetical protein
MANERIRLIASKGDLAEIVKDFDYEWAEPGNGWIELTEALLEAGRSVRLELITRPVREQQTEWPPGAIGFSR